MVSDIKGLGTRQTTGPRQGETGSVRNGGRSADAKRVNESNAPDDTVELSGLSEAIQAAARKLASESPVDEAKVKEIKSSVASGDYAVDPERLARKLIDADNS